jgi:galactokinase
MNTNETKNFKRSVNANPRKDTRDYSYYSRVLNKPFDSVEELKLAEADYYAELKAKEDKAAVKKADAKKVEDAFRALNAARKTYKEDLTTLTNEYSESMANLKKAYELGTADIREKLSAAENAYKAALKEFTNAYPEGYHVTLRDGDFETTIDSKTSANSNSAKPTGLFDLFDLFFSI